MTSHTLRQSVTQQLLLPLLFLELQPILSLQPAFCCFVWNAVVILHRTEILRYTADVMGSAIFRGMVIGRKVTQRRAGREERQQIWRELVRHLKICLMQEILPLT